MTRIHDGKTIEDLELMVERAEQFKKFDAELDQEIAQVCEFGRCGESAGSEQKKAGTVPIGAGLSRSSALGADLIAPPLSNEQRPIQPRGYVSEDGGWIPDWRDEEPSWSDSDTAREMVPR